VSFLGIKQVPVCVIPPYQQFFASFIPEAVIPDVKTAQSLKILLALAMEIDADMKWLAHLENPAQVLVEAAWLNTDEQIEVSTMLCCQRKFFSTSYFETIKEILQDSYTCKILFNTLDNCFDFLLA
jgi:hypothetical protein